MRLRAGWFIAALLVCLAAAGCTKASSGEEESSGGAASTQAIAGSDAVRVTLTPAAARRLDVQTAPIADVRSSRHGRELEVPYAAILYDPAGDTWVYTATEPLSYVRAPVTVDRIVGSEAIVSSGPPAGTEVVTVGASELLGVEYEVGEE